MCIRVYIKLICKRRTCNNLINQFPNFDDPENERCRLAGRGEPRHTIQAIKKTQRGDELCDQCTAEKATRGVMRDLDRRAEEAEERRRRRAEEYNAGHWEGIDMKTGRDRRR